MKHLIISTILIGFVVFQSNSQSVFMKQNGVSQVYYTISDVFTNAVSGDTIYLPGGVFSIGNLQIDESLTVIGAGHHPDSTTATYATTLSGNIYLGSNASFGSIQGIYLTGALTFGISAGNQTITNYTISRSSFDIVHLGYDYWNPGSCSYISIMQSEIRNYIRGSNAQFVNIENNIIKGSVSFFDGNVMVRNNTFIGGSGCPSYHMESMNSAQFVNNIFMNNGACSNSTITSTGSSIFEYNVFNGNYTFPFGTNLGNGNMVNISHTGFFVNETNLSYEYTDDIHLSAPATYLGNDGSQVGIYGGFFPYKPGAVPMNPHIVSKTIAPQTDVNGDLNINITVGAQEN